MAKYVLAKSGGMEPMFHCVAPEGLSLNSDPSGAISFATVDDAIVIRSVLSRTLIWIGLCHVHEMLPDMSIVDVEPDLTS